MRNKNHELMHEAKRPTREWFWICGQSRGRFLQGGAVQGTLGTLSEWEAAPKNAAMANKHTVQTLLASLLLPLKVSNVFFSKTFKWLQFKGTIQNNKLLCGAFAYCGFSQFYSTDLLFNDCCDNPERVSE